MFERGRAISSCSTTLLDPTSTLKGRVVSEHFRELILQRNVHDVVVFRGSDSGSDWFANFQASQDPGPFESTGAHEGFQDSLYPAVIKLTEILREDSKEPRRVWITGHSLGGAMATLKQSDCLIIPQLRAATIVCSVHQYV